jgi:hypothetical protein
VKGRSLEVQERGEPLDLFVSLSKPILIEITANFRLVDVGQREQKPDVGHVWRLREGSFFIADFIAARCSGRGTRTLRPPRANSRQPSKIFRLVSPVT